ncbi:MAG: hypothetical protein ACRDRW_20095 [Pseudonocardiaceae bacterium]
MNATMTVVPGGRHFLPENHPQVLVHVVLDALEHTATNRGKPE